MNNRKWQVLVLSTGHIYIMDPNENYLLMGSVLEAHEAESKEEAETMKATLEANR